MTIHWHKLIVKLLFWLMTEAILNFVGLDNLANYSEFLMAQHLTIPAIPHKIVLSWMDQ
jgi:hypothetical protein